MEASGTHRQRVAGQLSELELRIDSLHEKIFASLPPDAPPIESYPQKITMLLPIVDQYDRLIAREQILVAKSRGLVETAPSYELRLDVYAEVIRLRREIPGLVRSHAQMAVAFDPQKQTWEDVLSDRRTMIQAIRVRNNQINQIGGALIPQKIAYAMAPIKL